MKFIRKHLKVITIIIIIILIIVLSLLKIYLSNNSTINEESITSKLEIIDEETTSKEDSEEMIEKEIVYVDIKGAINNPGVYEIESNKKVIDVVALAGGLTDNADTSLINLAKKVTNEMVVIIYTKEEVENAKQEEPIIKIVEKECVCPEITNDGCIENIKENTNTPSLDATTTSKINLNTATLEELQTLDGIGESKAKTIIEYREKMGKFSSIEDLLKVTGIGESLYEKIKNNITV